MQTVVDKNHRPMTMATADHATLFAYGIRSYVGLGGGASRWLNTVLDPPDSVVWPLMSIIPPPRSPVMNPVLVVLPATPVVELPAWTTTDSFSTRST